MRIGNPANNEFFLGLNKYFISPKVYKNVYTNFLAYPLIIKKESGIKRKNLQIFLEKNNIQALRS